MKSGRRAAGLLAILAAFTPSPAFGQRPQGDSVVAAAVRQAWVVRISADQGRTIGRLSNPVGGSVDLVGASGRRTIPIAAIDTLWARGNAAKTGAIVGGILGAASGAFLGWIVAAVCDAAECNDPGSQAAIGGLAGLPIGVLMGAGVGTLFPRWHRKLP